MYSMIRQVRALFEQLTKSVVKDVYYIGDIEIADCGYKTDNNPPAADKFRKFIGGESWGTGIDSHAWFHMHINVPEKMQGDDMLELVAYTERGGWDADNPQFLCYIDGVMRQGMDVNHKSVRLGGGKKEYDVYLYAYTGPRIASAKFAAELRTYHKNVSKLIYDINVPLMALSCLDDNTMEYMETLTILSNTLLKVNFLEPRGEEFFKSVDEADEYIEKELYTRTTGFDAKVTCIGHTHIDLAWLWTVSQTREKAQRSFATVNELMDRYPDYKFMSSQAYLYKAVKEEAPELYEKVKARIREGRWEVEGAMWVEADCNLTSGESLARQILLGKNFFKDEFGVDSKVLWLPDVFGYSAALPQILKKSGVDWFVTSKISWNDLNTLPYDVFSWKGLDGTAVNTFFITAQDKGKGTGFTKGATYVGNTNPPMIAGSYNRMQQKELTRESIVTFGFGDGGGGPTAEMLEVAERQKNGMPGLPKAEIGFAGDMLKRIAERIKDNPRLPEWQGELYLEFHRGTYTSNARNKKNNRYSEFLLQDGEFMSSAAKILGSKEEYPYGKLREDWELVLLDQFHDIIPGSSIREVYEQTDRDYKKIKEDGCGIIENAENYIAENIDTDEKYVVFNPHSFTGKGHVKINGKTYSVSGIAPKGYSAFTPRSKKSKIRAEITPNGAEFDTPYYTVHFDKNLEISRIYDKNNDREVLAPDTLANTLRIFEDYPDVYDNWEIQEYSGYKYISLTDYDSAEIVEDGPRTGLRIVRTHCGSTIDQTVWFYDDDAKIDFATKLDWHCHHRILRTAFPVDINSDKATFEVQFGEIERPTHKNTSWDRMKFETCAHKYADISEGNYGVSLLNDCKYGHDIHKNVIQMTLLKCGTYPNEVADQGAHEFTYSLLPHAGTLKDSDTLREAFYLNYPMRAVKVSKNTKRTLPAEYCFITTSKENVVIETVKKAEKSDDIVIRMYEAKNFRVKSNFRLGFEAKSVSIAGIMENETEKVDIKNVNGKTEFELDIKPFEIVTLLVKI